MRTPISAFSRPDECTPADSLVFVQRFLREGTHLVSLGGQDPLTRFTTEITLAFRNMESTIDAAVLDALDHARISDGRVDFDSLGIRGPSSTWTYLVNDDPFRDQIGRMLTGPGRTTVAIYAAAIMMALLLVWGLVDRVLRRPSAGRIRSAEPWAMGSVMTSRLVGFDCSIWTKAPRLPV